MSHLRALPYAVLTMSLLATGGASAQSMWSIDGREASQQQRIDAGRRDGSLTRSEAYRLQQDERRIDRYEARARADGVVTPGERQRLDGMLDRESRQINRERNDGQRAGGPAGGHDNGNHYGWDRGNHNGWNQADADRNGRYNGGQNHGSWNQGAQPTAPGTPPSVHTGWDGNGQGTGQTRSQPSDRTNDPNSGRNSGWTHTANASQASPYIRSSQTRGMPASAPVSAAVAPSRTPSSAGRTSNH